MPPTYQLMPALDATAYESLKADILERGLMVPVEVDEDGTILDGHHRAQICDEAGIDWRTGAVVRAGWVEEAKRLHVRRLNILRRHLKGKFLAEQIRAMAAEQGSRVGTAGGRPKKGENLATLRGLAAQVGVSERTVTSLIAADQAIEEADDPALTEQWEQGEIGAVEAQRAAKQKIKQRTKAAVADTIRQAPPPPPTGPFGVIVIDPPWKYTNRVEDTTHRARLAYPEMTQEQIAALPIPTLAEDNAILWLWTTNAFMHDAYHLLDGWGFTPKTVLTWAKSKMGTGDWLRGKTEHCILAVRGRPIVTLTNQTTLLEGPVREHSRKPDEFYALVEALCPGSKVDVFARESRDGWATWGAEAGKFDG